MFQHSEESEYPPARRSKTPFRRSTLRPDLRLSYRRGNAGVLRPKSCPQICCACLFRRNSPRGCPDHTLSRQQSLTKQVILESASCIRAPPLRKCL